MGEMPIFFACMCSCTATQLRGNLAPWLFILVTYIVLHIIFGIFTNNIHRMPPTMQDPNLIQQIQQMSQQQEQLQSEIGAQEQLRRRVLEQQQQQFDREIGHVRILYNKMLMMKLCCRLLCFKCL